MYYDKEAVRHMEAITATIRSIRHIRKITKSKEIEAYIVIEDSNMRESFVSLLPAIAELSLK